MTSTRTIIDLATLAGIPRARVQHARAVVYQYGRSDGDTRTWTVSPGGSAPTDDNQLTVPAALCFVVTHIDFDTVFRVTTDVGASLPVPVLRRAPADWYGFGQASLQLANQTAAPTIGGSAAGNFRYFAGDVFIVLPPGVVAVSVRPSEYGADYDAQTFAVLTGCLLPASAEQRLRAHETRFLA